MKFYKDVKSKFKEKKLKKRIIKPGIKWKSVFHRVFLYRKDPQFSPIKENKVS